MTDDAPNWPAALDENVADAEATVGALEAAKRADVRTFHRVDHPHVQDWAKRLEALAQRMRALV